MVAIAIAGCAALPPCDSGLAGLACRAERGDPWAQLELGKAVEQVDPRRAARFYSAAAATAADTMFVYVPGVQDRAGYVLPVRTGGGRPGLPEAAYRLGRLYLEGRGVRRDVARGEALIARAARGGYPPTDGGPAAP